MFYAVEKACESALAAPCRRRPVGSGDAVRTEWAVRCSRSLTLSPAIITTRRTSFRKRCRTPFAVLLPIGRGPAPARGCFPSRGTMAVDCLRRRPSAAPSRWTTFPPPSRVMPPSRRWSCCGFSTRANARLVILCVYTALPYKELAALLGITVPAAQKRYQRAMKKLRAL